MARYRVQFFRRELGWYWRLLARNGRLVAIGGEPFHSRRNARASFRRLGIAAREVP